MAVRTLPSSPGWIFRIRANDNLSAEYRVLGEESAVQSLHSEHRQSILFSSANDVDIHGSTSPKTSDISLSIAATARTDIVKSYQPQEPLLMVVVPKNTLDVA